MMVVNFLRGIVLILIGLVFFSKVRRFVLLMLAFRSVAGWYIIELLNIVILL